MIMTNHFRWAGHVSHMVDTRIPKQLYSADNRSYSGQLKF